MDAAELLRRHNPVLVLFPQEFRGRRRPGAWLPGRAGWGDYHPCPAEFFLDRVEQRDHPKAWSFRPRDLLKSVMPWAWRPAPRTGLAALRAKAAAVAPGATAHWELDVSDIPSQDESRAWREYRRLLQETEDPYRPVVYGRLVEGTEGTVLQYWYLYLYNDFRNNHEGDWEMATIEIDADGNVVRVGYSSHHSGLRRPWSDVPRATPGGDRPLLFVGRGSHAGFFRYYRRGHPVVGFSPSANPPFGLRHVVAFLQSLPGLRRWRDFPPADPEGPPPRSHRHRGVRLDPEVRVVPEGEPAATSDWWWLRLRCPWGSTHSRFAGTVGPGSPWAGSGFDRRWHDPIGWLNTLEDDTEPLTAAASEPATPAFE